MLALSSLTVDTFIQGHYVGLLLSFNMPVDCQYNALCAENTLAVVQSSYCVGSEKNQLWQSVGVGRKIKMIVLIYCFYWYDS